MISKVILLTMSPFNERDYKRFGVEIFEKNGLNVEIWDLTGVLYPMRKSHHKSCDSISCNQLIEFYSKKDLVKKIVSLNNQCLVICLLNFDHDSLFIYRALKKAKIGYILNFCNVPPPAPKMSATPKTFSLLGRFFKEPLTFIRTFTRNVINILIVKCPPWMLSVSLPKYLLLGGLQSYPHNSMFNASKSIWAHTFDYDRYLEFEEMGLMHNEENLAVFLDHGTPYHPDHLNKNTTPISPEAYYPGIVDFFEKIEKETGLEVVIAAHPRWNFEEHSDHYGGRTIIRDRTIELVKKSKLVIAHNSTSLNYANIYRKPVLFIMSAAHGPCVVGAAANAFGKTAHKSANEQIDWENEFKISEQHYYKYRENYIKVQGTPECYTWQIVVDVIKHDY